MNPPACTPALRVVFFGTPAFATPTLENLLRSRHQVVGIVTQPDRPRGRGQRPAEGPVKQVARQQGLPLLQPDRLGDPAFLHTLSLWQADIGVVAAYGKILPPTVLAIPRLGLINVHASLLPKYRGAAPVQRAVMAGETETGVTIIRVIREMDAGPMLGAVVQPIDVDQTSEDLERHLASLGAVLLLSVVDDIAEGRAQAIAQDPDLVTYAPRLAKSDGLIDWARPARRLHDQVRGLHPWPHAFTYSNGARYIILRSRVEPDTDRTSGWASARPGEILAAVGDRLVVKCGDQELLAVLHIQPEGKRALSVREFLSGHPLRPGQVFGSTPPAPKREER